MTCLFDQLRCTPGTAYDDADWIALKEIHSEMQSTSGEYDLLLKVYVPEGEDVGRYINEQIGRGKNIERTLTTLTFSAF